MRDAHTTHDEVIHACTYAHATDTKAYNEYKRDVTEFDRGGGYLQG